MVRTSVAIAFATFMIIVIYHVVVRNSRDRGLQNGPQKPKTLKATVKEKNNQNNHIQQANFNPLIELHEPLLESANWLDVH